MFKAEKGITLVALVITIIVLIILAGVSIAAVTTFNIPGNAKTAAESYKANATEENNLLNTYNDTVQSYMPAQ